jgi:hypothetical protein
MLGNELTQTEARDLLKRKTPIPRGHAWKPGSGPAGGPGSDVRAKDPACKFWEREEPE